MPTTQAKPTGPAKFKARRGRPSADQVAAIDASLLDTGRTMFLRDGYDATSMEAVAQAAGVSKPTLYSRYSDKAALFNAIVAERLDAWEMEATRPVVDPAASISDVLTNFATSMLAALRVPEVAAFDHLIAAEASRFPELAQALYDRGYDRAVGWLALALFAARGHAFASEQAARDVADTFMAALLGWNRRDRLREGASDEAREQFARFVSTLFVHGCSSS